jgi:uncharacterized protein YwgA
MSQQIKNTDNSEEVAKIYERLKELDHEAYAEGYKKGYIAHTKESRDKTEERVAELHDSLKAIETIWTELNELTYSLKDNLDDVEELKKLVQNIKLKLSSDIFL